MTPDRILSTLAEERGWDAATQLELMYDFIDQQGDANAFKAFLEQPNNNRAEPTEYRFALGLLCFSVYATSEAEARAIAKAELQTLHGAPLTLTPKLTHAVLYAEDALEHDDLELHDRLEVAREFPEPPQEQGERVSGEMRITLSTLKAANAFLRAVQHANDSSLRVTRMRLKNGKFLVTLTDED